MLEEDLEDEEDDEEDDEDDDEELFFMYFFATYPVVPLTFTLYQLPLVEITSTVVPFLIVFSTLLSALLLFRTFSELAVTVPVQANALNSGIMQVIRQRMNPAFHFLTQRTSFLDKQIPSLFYCEFIKMSTAFVIFKKYLFYIYHGKQNLRSKKGVLRRKRAKNH